MGSAPGQQRVLLEDQAPIQAGSGNGDAVQQDLPGGGAGQAAEQVQQGGLAAAAGADEHQELPGADVQGDVFQRGHPAGGAAPAPGTPGGELVPDPVEAQFRGHWPSPVVPPPAVAAIGSPSGPESGG